jgi:hypothetical protein
VSLGLKTLEIVVTHDQHNSSKTKTQSDEPSTTTRLPIPFNTLPPHNLNPMKRQKITKSLGDPPKSLEGRQNGTILESCQSVSHQSCPGCEWGEALGGQLMCHENICLVF